MRRMFAPDIVGDGGIFHVWPKKFAYYHDKVRANIVGGPSIVFNRYHEAGRTRILGGYKVQSVQGMDANSLYLG